MEFVRRHKDWTVEEDDFIKENFSTMTYKEMSNKLGRTFGATKMRCYGFNLKRDVPRYETNVDYFNTWSSKMAYILGFITADGCVDEEYRLQISLNTKDTCVLDFIKSEIRPTSKYIYRNQKNGDKVYPQVCLSIYSKPLVLSLNKLEVIPRKTNHEKLPNIPEEFKGDFLRGLFDGDGSILTHYDKRWENNISQVYQISSGATPFLENVKEVLGMSYGYVSNHSNHMGNWANWKVYKSAHIQDIYNLMYKDPNSFCLLRKKEKFLCSK